MTDAISTGPPGRRAVDSVVADCGTTPAGPPEPTEPAGQIVTELYQRNWVGLLRMALVLVGDRPTAEDVVQEAFAGLCRALPRLADPDRALGYLRSSVINRCRSVHRSRSRADRWHRLHRREDLPIWSAESAALAREESRLALQAVARLPDRAREVLVLRYLLDLSDGEIAAALGISKGTVSSTASRSLAALARDLKE